MSSQHDQISRHLVATSDKSTWDIGNPMLFLGTWCFSPEPLLEHGAKDLVVLDYHLKTPAQLLRAGNYVDNYYERLLKELCKRLNQIHRLNWDEKSWRILIGPWLHRHIEIYYDRWRNIERALRKYNLTSHSLPLPKGEDLIPLDYDDLGESAKTDEWNNLVYGLLITRQSSKVRAKKVRRGNTFGKNKKNAVLNSSSHKKNTITIVMLK